MSSRPPRILVVGSGPVGLFTALLLARRELRVEVIDQSWRTGAHSYALALHARSLSLLEQVGITSRILEKALRVQRIVFCDAEGQQAVLDMSALPTRNNTLAILPQATLESLLVERLEAEGVHVRWNHRLAALDPRPGRVRATIHRLTKSSEGYPVAGTEWTIERTLHEDYDYVVGADGARSVVRQQLGIAWDETAPPQDFAVFEFRLHRPLEPETRVVLTDDLSAVLWPLPQAHARWSFELPPDASRSLTREKSPLLVECGFERYPELSQEHFEQFLRTRAPWFKAGIQERTWSVLVRFERRLARRFGEGRCWLVGDAAHCTSPIGAQSMNAGLLEAHELAHRLIRVLLEGDPAEVLEEYDEQARRTWRVLHGLEDGLTVGPDTGPWVRRHVEQIRSAIPAVDEDLALLAAQIGLRLRLTDHSTTARV